MFSFFSSSGIPRRSSLGKMIDQSTMLLMFAIGSLILILALMILFHENANATKGYRLRTLEHERSQLLLSDEVLKMQIAQEQALEKLQADAKVQAMVVPAKPIYINGARGRCAAIITERCECALCESFSHARAHP